MTATVVWVLVLVVALIVGPFATLRAVSHFKARKAASPPRPPAPPAAAEGRDDADGSDDSDDSQRPGGFW